MYSQVDVDEIVRVMRAIAGVDSRVEEIQDEADYWCWDDELKSESDSLKSKSEDLEAKLKRLTSKGRSA